MSTETSTSPLLAEGRGVVVRDTQGIGAPVLGRVETIGAEYALVRTEDSELHRFELSTLCAMLPGEHERWKLTAPDTPSSEEYGDLLIRQARLQAQIERLRKELGIVTAVLETADDLA